MRRWRKRLIVIAIGVTLLWLFIKLGILPSPRNIFYSKPVIIDETPILIKEIRSVGQLITATFYDEVVVDSLQTTKASRFISSINKLVPLLPPADKKLVLIARGKILAGTDLKLLGDSSVRTSADTVWLTLPKTKILDIIMNPSDFETFEEKGDWSPAAVTAVKLKAREKMIDRAFEQGIIEKANSKAKAVMEDFVRASGFKVILFLE
jgi:hypothetical protein